MKPMLAADLEGETAELPYPLLGSYKVDGVRALIWEGCLLSRSLKGIPNMYVRQQLGDEALEGLDGELVVGAPYEDPFRRTVSAVMSYAEEPDFMFYVFDWLCAPSAAYELRLDRLRRIVERANARVEVLPQRWLANESEVLAFEEEALELGYEGVILRCPKAPYKYGRSTVREAGMLKLKRFTDAEALVLSVDEQMQNTNVLEKDNLGHAKRSTKKEGMVGKDTLGALWVVGVNGPYKDKRFSVGTGFDDALRQRLWREHHAGKSVTGQIVKYKYFPSGSKDAPRFPVFLGFRDKGDMS